MKESDHEDKTSYVAAIVIAAFAITLYLDLLWIWYHIIQGIVCLIFYDCLIYKRETQNENKKLYAVLTVIATVATIHLNGSTWIWLPIFKKLLYFGFFLIELFTIIKLVTFSWNLWKEKLLCWLINKYFGTYVEKEVAAERNLTVEWSKNYETLLFRNVHLNCKALNNIAFQKNLSFRFSSVSFDRLVITADYRSLRLDCKSLHISMEPMSPIETSKSKTPDELPWIFGVTLFPILYIIAVAIVSNSPFQLPLPAILFSVIVAAMPTVAVVLCCPQIQTAIATAILNKYIGKYFHKQYMSLDQVDADLWKGSLALIDVVLDCNVLNELATDKRVKMKMFGVGAESISLEVPWINFALNSSIVNLTQVSLTVQPEYWKHTAEYRERMLKACHAYVNHIENLYPASVIADIKLQLDNIATSGHLFYEPNVEFKANGANIQVVAQFEKKLEIPKPDYIGSAVAATAEFLTAVDKTLTKWKYAAMLSQCNGSRRK